MIGLALKAKTLCSGITIFSAGFGITSLALTFGIQLALLIVTVTILIVVLYFALEISQAWFKKLQRGARRVLRLGFTSVAGEGFVVSGKKVMSATSTTARLDVSVAARI